MNYVDKHALVLGLGESGLAMAQWLLHCGARVRVADTRDEQAVAERLAALRAASGDIEFVGGRALSADLLDGVDFVAVSPGLAPGRELVAVSAAANERNIPLWGEMELFAQALAALREERAYAPKVLAITGTNGKTTVTSLTGMLCRRAGLTTKVAGNISPAVLDVLRQALIDDDAHAKVVAEQMRIEQEAAALQAEADAVEAEKLAAEAARQAAIEAAEAARKAAEEAELAAAAAAQLELREQEEAAELQAAIDEAANELKEAGAPAAQAARMEGDAVLSVDASAEPDAETAAIADEVVPEIDAQAQAEQESAGASAPPQAGPADEEDTTPLQLELPPPEPEKVYTGILPQAWVLELSSFQLHSTHSLQPSAATVLNVTQDHLDWHGDMEAYAADKAKIFGDNTVRVLNRDDPLVMQMTRPGANISSFGMSEPSRAGDFGLVDENGMLWLANAVAIEDEEKPEGRRRKKDPKEVVEQPFQLKRLMPADALRIRGLHNALNGLAALALCRAVDLPLAPLLHGLREYTGEPHRVELVTTIQDVEYYDDSKGTNVGATVAALNGLGHGGTPNRLLLIAGGEGKGQDFAPLAEPLSKYGRAVFLIGRDAGAIRSAVADSGVELIDCATLEEAVEKAGAMARGATPCCYRRPAPASTCSATMRIAPKFSSTPCVSWPCRAAR